MMTKEEFNELVEKFEKSTGEKIDNQVKEALFQAYGLLELN